MRKTYSLNVGTFTSVKMEKCLGTANNAVNVVDGISSGIEKWRGYGNEAVKVHTILPPYFRGRQVASGTTVDII